MLWVRIHEETNKLAARAPVEVEDEFDQEKKDEQDDEDDLQTVWEGGEEKHAGSSPHFYWFFSNWRIYLPS